MVEYDSDWFGDEEDLEDGQSGEGKSVDDKDIMKRRSEAHPPIVRQTKYKKRKVSCCTLSRWCN